jgi:predicted nucleic acid-binding protein
MMLDGDFVLDASCALALVLKESHRPAVRSVVIRAAEQGHRCLVPDLFDAECASGIAKAVRRGRLGGDLWAEAWAAVADLELERRPSQLLGLSALRIAMDHAVSTYDALYVALSAEERVPLLTADAKLARALRGSPHDVRLLEDLDST